MSFKIIPASGPTVKGLDIYYRNSVENFVALSEQGYKFLFHKASEGLTFVDPKMRLRWPKIRAAFPVVGLYHYFHPGMDPLKQAQHFVDCVKPVFEHDVMLWCDWETIDGLPSALDRERGLAFLKEVERLIGKKPGIYSGPYFLQALALDSRFASYSLWIAEYSVSAPKIPAPFAGWKFWQTGDNGIDQDVFNGTIDELKALASL